MVAGEEVALDEPPATDDAADDQTRAESRASSDEADEGGGFSARLDESAFAASGFAASGVLERIRVENFMCHRCFEFTFGPNVNIINGHNGSGKSAIVAALQIGLGARTSSTERGRSLSQYIKHGEDHALIYIQIRNRLMSANDVDERYRPDLYSDAVVIERRLSWGGTGGGWAFRDGRGKRVRYEGTPREELNNILDHFNIQVANPIAILTQQRSKQFMKSGRETEMYRLFMEATGLQQVKSELEATLQERNKIAEQLIYKQKLAGVSDEHIQQLERRLEDAREMEHIEKRIEDKEAQWVWTLVAEEEDELSRAKGRLDDARRTLEKYRAEDEHAQQDVELAKNKVDTLNEGIDAATNELRSHSAKVSTLNEQVRAKRSLVNSQKADEDSLRKSVDEARRRARQFESDLNDAMKGHDNSHGERQRLSLELADKKAERERVQANLLSLRGSSDVVGNELQQLHDEVSRERYELRRYENMKRQTLDELARFQRAGANSLARWGEHIPQLVQRIEEAHQRGEFHRKPIGPVGAHVRVSDEKWIVAVQHCIQTLLTTFLVHDVHDQRVLRRLGANVSIVQTSFDAAEYDISAQSRAPAQYLCVKDVLTIASPQVHNVLVDQLEIERQVLITDDAEARRLGDAQLQTVRRCWMPDGSQTYSRNSASVFRSGDPRMHVLLAPDISQVTTQLRARAEEEELKRAEAEKAVRQTSDRQLRRAEDQRRLHEQLEEHRADLSNLGARIIALETKLEESSNTVFDSSTWRVQIDRCLADAAEKDVQLRDVSRRLQAATEELEKALERKQNEVGAGSSIEQRQERLNGELDATTEAYRRSLAVAAQRQRRTENAAAEIATASAQIDKEEVQLSKEVEQAKNICSERVPRSEKSAHALEADLKALKARLLTEQERHAGRSLAEIEREYWLARERNEKNQANLATAQMYLKRVKDGYSKRFEKYSRMKRDTKKVTNAYFNHFMRKRKHIGEIVFNDSDPAQAPELLFKVGMASHRRQSGGLHQITDMSALSGGERNYTTLSFMLALGESMDVPVRVMDEFDVYMDEANRRSSYQTLLEVTKDMPGRQFIFITPLLLPNVQASARLNIQRLNPPDRGSGHQRLMDQYVAGDGGIPTSQA